MTLLAGKTIPVGRGNGITRQTIGIITAHAQAELSIRIALPGGGLQCIEMIHKKTGVSPKSP